MTVKTLKDKAREGLLVVLVLMGAIGIGYLLMWGVLTLKIDRLESGVGIFDGIYAFAMLALVFVSAIMLSTVLFMGIRGLWRMVREISNDDPRLY